MKKHLFISVCVICFAFGVNAKYTIYREYDGQVPNGDCLEMMCQYGCVEDESFNGTCCPNDGTNGSTCTIEACCQSGVCINGKCGCEKDTDCAGEQVCLSDKTCGCLEGVDKYTKADGMVGCCSAETPKWDAEQQKCIECLTDTDCEGEATCDPTTKTCVGKCVPLYTNTRYTSEVNGSPCCDSLITSTANALFSGYNKKDGKRYGCCPKERALEDTCCAKNNVPYKKDGKTAVQCCNLLNGANLLVEKGDGYYACCGKNTPYFSAQVNRCAQCTEDEHCKTRNDDYTCRLNNYTCACPSGEIPYTKKDNTPGCCLNDGNGKCCSEDKIYTEEGQKKCCKGVTYLKNGQKKCCINGTVTNNQCKVGVYTKGYICKSCSSQKNTCTKKSCASASGKTAYFYAPPQAVNVALAIGGMSAARDCSDASFFGCCMCKVAGTGQAVASISSNKGSYTVTAPSAKYNQLKFGDGETKVTVEMTAEGDKYDEIELEFYYTIID